MLEEKFPHFIIDFIENYDKENTKNISLKIGSVMRWGEDTDKEEIARPKRFIRGEGEEVHQFLILHNNQNKARLFYKPPTKNLRFLSKDI